MFKKINSVLHQEVDSSLVSFFRILFGLCLAGEALRVLISGWINQYYISPKLLLKYELFDFLPQPNAAFAYLSFALMTLAGLLIALGFLYRLSVFLYFILYSYFFLLTKNIFNNHYYFIILLCFLMFFVQANNGFNFRKNKAYIPYWPLFLVRCQIFIVYFYAGLAKFDYDWFFRQEPMRFWLHDSSSPLGQLLANEMAVFFLTYSSLAFDLIIPVLLWTKRFRVLAIILCFLFHSFNFLFFSTSIGVFPFLMMACTLLFLPPHWPRSFLARFRIPYSPQPEFRTVKILRFEKPILTFFVIYLLAQALVPLRHWLYPGRTLWTQEGHRFAWRMKLVERRAGMRIFFRNPQTGEAREVNFFEDLDINQAADVAGKADSLLQYVHYLKEKIKVQENIEEPEIYVLTSVILNGSVEKPIVDPSLNLAAEPIKIFGHYNWINIEEKELSAFKLPPFFN